MQRALADGNRVRPDDQQLQLRVGLNSGEAIREDGDLFGSTVDAAARTASAPTSTNGPSNLSARSAAATASAKPRVPAPGKVSVDARRNHEVQERVDELRVVECCALFFHTRQKTDSTFSLMPSAIYSASAWIVEVGLTPPAVTKTLPSTIKRFLTSCACPRSYVRRCACGGGVVGGRERRAVGELLAADVTAVNGQA